MKPGPPRVVRARSCWGCERQAGIADLVDLRVVAEALGEDPGVVLGALEPQRQRAEAAQAEVGLQRAGRRAAEFSRLTQDVQVGVAADDRGAEEQVGVAADGLGGAVDDDVGAEFQRALQQRRGERVVHDAEQRSLARGGAQAGKVGDAEQWIGRRLQPEDARSFAGREDRVGVGDVDQPHLRSTRLLQFEQNAADVHVGDLGGDDDRVGVEQAHGCRRGRHPGGERQRMAALQRPEHLFECLPRRVAVARVAGHAAGLECRRRGHRHVERPIGDRRRPAERDHRRLRPQRLFAMCHETSPSLCPRTNATLAE